MTSNQIAAQSERELERHNLEAEEVAKYNAEEVKRHNQAMEFLTEQQNQITQWYQTEKIRLDEWYNQAYIEYLKASEEDKVRLEEELNQIKWQQTEAENEYKKQMAAISKATGEAEVTYKQLTGQASYMNAETQAKRVEYEKHQWDTENYLRMTEFGIRHEELAELQKYHEQQYLLGIRNVNAISTQNYLRSQELEWTKMYQGSLLTLQQEMLPYNISKSEAETKYIDSTRINTNIKSFDILNPFSSKRAADATDIASKLIRLTF